MQKRQEAVVNGSTGHPVQGATVTVTTLLGVAATIYTADGTGLISGNTVTTDANGRYYYYAADGRYTETITGSGIVSTVITDILLEDPVDGLAALSASGGSALIGFLPSGTGAIATTVETKNRQTKSVFDSMTAAQIADVLASGALDVTTALQTADTDRPTGSTLIWPAGTYKITGDITAAKAGAWLMQGVTINSTAGRLLVAASNFTLEGGQSALNFTPGAAASSLNRAVRCSGAITTDSPGYGVTGTIAVGATSFTADDSAEAATLSNGDWIIVVNHDVSNWVRVEHKQVLSVVGTTITVTEPFKQAFDGTYTIEYVRVSTVRENVKIKNLRITIADTSQDNIGMDFQPGVVNSELSGCAFNVAKGLAFSIYGGANIVVENNDILRQQGRQSAWSSNTGGRIALNKFRNSVAAATSGGITMETGSYGACVLGNNFFGANVGTASIYANNINGCTFDDNIFVGNGSNIGVLFFGSSDNKFGSGNLIVNTTEGVTIQKDTAPTPDLNSDRNVIAWPGFKNCTTAVSIKDSNCNNNVVLIASDSTVTTPISDSGTGTLALRRDGTTGAMRFLGGVHVGNVANANTAVLDWYEEGSWNPVLTFATVGDLNVTYSVQTGKFTRIGNKVIVDFHVTTSAFTYTTASGNFKITGLPYAAAGVNSSSSGSMGGYTNANVTQVSPHVASGDSFLQILGGGSGQNLNFLTNTDVPTGGTKQLRCSLTYEV